MGVVRVDEVGGPRERFDHEAPADAGIEARSPGHLTHRDTIGRRAAGQLAAAPGHQPLLQAGRPRQRPREQPNLVLAAAIFPPRVYVQDAHGSP